MATTGLSATAGSTGTGAAALDTPAGYVTMLRARRIEEEASRKLRSERRADFMNASLAGYRRREAAVRRGMMEAKLQMMSQVEKDVFEMLNEQAQWRHVMCENVQNREAQCREIEAEREALQAQHLQHTLEEEAKAFDVTVRDETERYRDTLAARSSADRAEAEAACRAVLADVTDLAANVLAFAQTKQADVDPSHPTSAMDLVPSTVFQLMKRHRVYSDPAEMVDRMADDHVSLASYAPKPENADGAHGPLFSSLVAKLLALQYPTPPPLRPKEVTPKAYIVLSGAHFTGKTTIAKALAGKFNLDYASDTSLVEDVIGELEADVTPADLESKECCDALVLGKEARQLLQNGQTITPSLMARLVLHKITYLAEDRDGILFDNVPNDAEAFAAVEAVLSGFSNSHVVQMPNPVLARTDVDGVDPDNALFTVERPEAPPPVPDAPGGKEGKKPEPKAAGKGKDKKKDEPEEPLPPIELPIVEPVPPLTEEEEEVLAAAEHTVNIAGLHRIIHLQCSAEEIFRRFSGIRVDMETGEEYHVTSNPPPLARMPFIAAKDRVDGDATQLHSALEHQARQWADVEKWARHFSELTSDVDATAALADVEAVVREAVEDARDTAAREYDAYRAAENLSCDRKEQEALYQERLATREQIRRQLAQVYTERGVAELPPELQEPMKKVVESRELVMHPATPATCLTALEDFTAYYKGVVGGVTEQVGTALAALFDYGVTCNAAYDHFWTQPDTKRKLVDGFVAELNGMPAGLRRDVQGKEELHLRADALFEALCAGVDKRREDCQAVVEAGASPAAFVESWGDGVRLLGSALIQLEVERFVMVKQIAATYFGGVKGDPVHFDEAELAVDLLLLPKAVHEPEPAAAPGKAGGKDAAKKPPPKGKDKAAAEKEKAAVPAPGEEVPPEDHVTPLVERAVGVARAVVDKLQPQAAAPVATGKAAKGAKAQVEVAPAAPEVATTNSLVLPIASAEFELCRKRIGAIADFMRALLDLGADRAAGMKKKLLSKLRDRVAAEMGAVSGCLFHLRSCIEEEVPVRHTVHLDGTEFAIDRGLPLVPVQLPQALATTNLSASAQMSGSLVAGAESPSAFLQQQFVLSCLTLDRIIRIIELLKAIAPKYTIPLDDFARIVTPADWATHAETPPASAEEVFKRFDIIGCGCIDWREFIVHLLLWAEPLVNGKAKGPLGASGASPNSFGPTEESFAGDGAFGPTVDRNPYFVEGPNLVQLFDMRTYLGSEPLTYDQFQQSEFFFDMQMDATRATNYKDVLWETFAVNDQVDPNTFVVFLCADEQPLRGCQKAFAMGAPVGDEACALSLEMLHSLFHFSACNYLAFGMEDMYSVEDLETLFVQNAAAQGSPTTAPGAAPVPTETVTFQEVCVIGSGRLLLNNTNIFRRRKFV